MHLFVLLCRHTSQQDQIDQMWLLVNPTLDDEIDAERIQQFMNLLSEIAVIQTKFCIQSIETPEDPVKRAQHEQCM